MNEDSTALKDSYGIKDIIKTTNTNIFISFEKFIAEWYRIRDTVVYQPLTRVERNLIIRLGRVKQVITSYESLRIPMNVLISRIACLQSII